MRHLGDLHLFSAEDVGMRMAAIRRWLGSKRPTGRLKQQEFADLIKNDSPLDEGNVSHWERGRQYPPEHVLRKLFFDFGISADWILFEAWSALKPETVVELREHLEAVKEAREKTGKKGGD